MRIRCGLSAAACGIVLFVALPFQMRFAARFDPAIVDIPTGFDFPNRGIATPPPRSPADHERIRRHAWMVWAGMTQPTDKNKLPVWATWPDSGQVFDPNRIVFTPSGGISGLEQSGQFEFIPPTPPDSQLTRPPNVTICQMSPLVSVLFNRQATRDIRDSNLNRTESLLKMKGSVPPFDPKAVVVKAMWWPVRNDKAYSAVPVWNEQLRYPEASGAPKFNSCGNGPMTWRDVIALDINRSKVPKDERTDIDFADPESETGRSRYTKVPVVPLRSIFSVPAASVPLSNEQIGLLNDLVRNFWPPGIQFDAHNDFLVLVGLHFATREIENWFWATLWWHDPLEPDDDKPQNVEDVWRYYRMECAVDADRIVFNPYLESRFSNGTLSNCLACHQRAALALENRPPEKFHTERGRIEPGNEYFRDKLRTQFLWSIPDRAK